MVLTHSWIVEGVEGVSGRMQVGSAMRTGITFLEQLGDVTGYCRAVNSQFRRQDRADSVLEKPALSEQVGGDGLTPDSRLSLTLAVVTTPAAGSTSGGFRRCWRGPVT
jgi:hypothetical protein